MVSGMAALNPASYGACISSGNKVYVQVKPNQVLYSQFEHVSGYSFGGHGDGCVPVSKIKILNSLIDQLVKMKSDKTKPKMPTDLSSEQVDAMIKDYQNKIQTAISTAKATPFGFNGMSGLPVGQVLNFSV